ncbi:hypothetical protein BDN72DRAFT_864126 [Pluteus cervinus]|uniref:Uncharacterized protein n=1 Tax=Pluteus cervinus TaxID=181527 RepID=A0ACD3A508_9AGAR|nr:hypothetical protein BDN72DRAFT_864126 [Pluteus cervinus]
MSSKTPQAFSYERFLQEVDSLSLNPTFTQVSLSASERMALVDYSRGNPHAVLAGTPVSENVAQLQDAEDKDFSMDGVEDERYSVTSSIMSVERHLLGPGSTSSANMLSAAGVLRSGDSSIRERCDRTRDWALSQFLLDDARAQNIRGANHRVFPCERGWEKDRDHFCGSLSHVGSAGFDDSRFKNGELVYEMSAGPAGSDPGSFPILKVAPSVAQASPRSSGRSGWRLLGLAPEDVDNVRGFVVIGIASIDLRSRCCWIDRARFDDPYVWRISGSAT